MMLGETQCKFLDVFWLALYKILNKFFFAMLLSS